jgi:hypothetical protein
MDTQLLLLLMLLQMQSYILMFFVVSRFAAFTGWTRDPLDAFTGWTRDFDWREQRELQQEYFQCLHFLRCISSADIFLSDCFRCVDVHLGVF